MWELLKQGGVVMYPLGLCSLLTVTIALERLWRFLRADRDPKMMLEKAKKTLAAPHNPHPHWQEDASPAGRVAGAAFQAFQQSRQALEESIRGALTAAGLDLSAHLGIVGTIGNIAPFIGLFGTVLGIIRAFRDIGSVGAAGPAVVATGISEALVATATGLFVAITSVIIYNAFLIWQGRILRRAELVGSELINLLSREENDGH